MRKALEDVGRPPVLATTATAPPHVREDILFQLGIADAKTVTTTFDRAQGHFGMDIVAKADAAVKACLEGTVIEASWTTDAGHVLHIQHRNDLVSIYKHNSVLLRKVGDKVRAGEAVAIVGNSGELTTGPHLHFELWLKGDPVDPQRYIVFE